MPFSKFFADIFDNFRLWRVSGDISTLNGMLRKSSTLSMRDKGRVLAALDAMIEARRKIRRRIEWRKQRIEV